MTDLKIAIPKFLVDPEVREMKICYQNGKDEKIPDRQKFESKLRWEQKGATFCRRFHIETHRSPSTCYGLSRLWSLMNN